MNNNEDKPPSTPNGRRADASSRHNASNNSSDSNSSPGGRSSLSSSPGSYVFRRGWLSSKKKDSLKKESLKMPKVARQQQAPQPQPQPRLSMRQAQKDVADRSFLRNFRSGSGDVSLDSARVDGTMGSSNTAATPNNDTVRTAAPAAAVSSLTPTRDNTSTTTAPAGYSDADNAFLRAMRGEPEQAAPSSKASPEKRDSFNVKPSTSSADASIRSDADNAFLRAFRGESQETVASAPKQAALSTVAQAAEPRSTYRDEAVGTKQPSVPASDDMAHANAAFLGALHASTDPPDGAMPFKGGTFVLDAKHHANLLQTQSSGSRSDADSAFLLAMRGSSQSSMKPTSFGGTDEFGGTGTLVLNMIPKQKQSEESSFFKSIDSEDSHVQHHRGDTKEDAHAVSEVEEEEDDEMEGLVVPSHPYIEKVLLPRPLFFGNQLPPRIIEEAEQAAKMYVNNESELGSSTKRGWLDKEDEVTGDSKELSSESATKESGDDSGSIHTKSTISTFSTTMGGGKLFESSLLPCARNFEGALETFGFGHNPFNANWNNAEGIQEGTDPNGLPKAPHPYISMYSPVWGDRARADRARSRLKKAKLADAEMKRDASNQSIESLNRADGSDGDRRRAQSTDPGEVLGKCSSNTTEADNQFLKNLRSGSPVSSQSMREEANNLFLSNLRSSSPVDFPSKTEEANNQFLSNLRSSSPINMQSSTEEANNQFLKNLRSSSPVDFPSKLEEATNQFLSNLRSSSPIDLPSKTEEANNQFLSNLRNSSPAVEEANNQFLSNLRSSSPVDVPSKAEEANNQFLSNLRNSSSVDSPATAEDANNQFLSNLRSSTPTLLTRTKEANKQFLSNLRSSSPVNLPARESDRNDSQDQFLMFARGDDAGGTFVGKPAGGGTFVVNKPKSDFKMDSSTFVAAVKSGDVGSDDDSIKNDEERMEVGLNDNMAAAAAMLAGEDDDQDVDDNPHGITTSVINLAAGGGAKAANKFGRPYSNLELTGGCVPRFSCDDPSLPHESDLGVFETKDEEKRSNERQREKKIIEDMTVPGIMPIVVCPTQCTDVDDSQSWNSRQAASDGGNNRKANNTVLISLEDNKSPTSSGSLPQGKSATYEASRLGWWNIPDGFDVNATGKSSEESKKRRNRPSPLVEVSPAFDDPVPLDVITNLWPSPQALRNNNISAAQLHSATSSARYMPHLSDRNPNLRHLQIDTTAVGFPKLGGEVEPMFCKLAIYHFEMNSGPSSDHDIDESVASTISSSGVSVASQPSRDRCGPVTEALNFDVVQDPEVIENCKRAIWPYASENELGYLPGAIGDSSKINDNVILEGSPCGVFPLPSYMHISNLYAVILVHKVVSDIGGQQPYLKPNRRDKSATSQKEEIDLAKLRENASKAAESYGQLITPIAFGVLPLMQIVGSEESPKVPVTRVVQIPLFKFEQGRGTDIILDHILGMLHPRANPKVGKVASMTRGHAFLVMRYFGFLGLHSIVSKIKMARNRLVDFTRELQVKRRGDVTRKESEKCPLIGDPYIVSPWRQQYVVEPAPFGGRSVPTQAKRLSVHVTSTTESSKAADDVNESAAMIGYAQELAALPLENSGIEVKPSRRNCSSRSSSAHKFDCMLFHTSFCNELICQPRILTNCPKKNVVIKIELRELQWNDSMKVEVAIPIKASIHNPRRGPWLVKEAFTSCALKAANPQFLDEFKIKLPLILGESERVVLFFSVYHVNVQTRKGSLLQTISRGGAQQGTDLDAALEHVGSGILPLTSDESPSCLLSNGEHKVPIQYRVLDLDNPADSRKHQSKLSTSSFGKVIGHLRSMSGNNEDAMRTISVDTISTDEQPLNANQDLILESLSYPTGTVFLERTNLTIPEASDDNDHKSINSESKANQLRHVPETSADSSSQGMRPSLSSGNLQQLGSTFKASGEVQHRDDLVLKVNIVAFSSVHPQNRILSDFFILKPDRPRCLTTGDFSNSLSPWGKHRSEILYRLKPERIPPFNFVGGALAETERKLLEPVVSLSKTSKCPAYDLIPHLLRVISQLWRTMVSGVGEPSLLWADPGSLIPLRLNAFATLLHVVSSASHYMAKAGLRLLDGDTKWNVSALSKTLSLLFDELKLFDGPLEELVQKEEVKTGSKKYPPNDNKASPKLLSKKPSKLTRSKTSNEQGTPKPNIIQRFSSEETKLPTSFDVDAMLSSAQSSAPQKVEETGNVFTTSRDMGLKVDTRNDFMSAMREAAASEKAYEAETAGNDQLSSHLMNSFGSTSNSLGPTSNRRRFFTLPAMATIRESESEDNRIVAQESSITSESSNRSEVKGSPLDTELIVHRDRAKPKQFRVPDIESISTSSLTKSETEESVTTASIESSLEKQNTLPANDDDIESAGTAFLDKISLSMGNLNRGKAMAGENRRLGAAHHRKTRSRCSVDWTLPPTDMLLEKDQQIEQRNRTKAGATTTPLVGFTNTNFPDDASTDDDTLGYESVDDGSVIEKQENETSTPTHPLKRKPKDRNTFIEPLVLPDFADRMSAMKDAGKPHRWWPYVYEVIIYQWLTLLIEQTKKGDTVNKAVEDSQVSKSTLSPIVVKYLSHAAKAARGATIRCAPYLLEIIKQSLSWRIDVMFRDRKKNKPLSNDVSKVVKLDENILTAVEKLVTMLTDASIDSRNFDSYEFRKISIDVNDAVVRFLRDLFSMLDVQSVHRLVMVYFSRFVTKEGKHWHDRDSKTTGLRCSWETTKLRLNAITLFVRFPDFMKVNMPLVERSWKSCSSSSSAGTTRRFYAGVLEKMTRLGLGDITSADGPISKSPVHLPKLRPHWLAELCTDILLSATGHAEEGIQHRASSLLFELFWTTGTEGRARGNISIVASVFVPFLTKVLAHIEYMSSLPGKCQLRKDIIPCVIFVLQSAPVGLMRALWRKLTKQAEGKTQQSDCAMKYGGILGVEGHSQVDADSALTDNSHGDTMHDEQPDVYDMFGLLNLSLSTIEYDGCEMKSSGTNGEACEENPVWRKEFLLSADRGGDIISAMDRRFPHKTGQGSESASDESTEQDTTHNSRRWHAHDCSMVIINSCRQIVRETLGMLKPSINSETDDFNGSDPTSIDFHGSLTFDGLFLSKSMSSSIDNVDSEKMMGQGDEHKAKRRHMRNLKMETLTFTINDTIIFVRAATSVYLHALTMRQSDVVVSKTLTACIEVVKIFGIKVFLNAVGETLQHWIRVTLEHCGARRADVRVEASEFLNLLLRLTWNSYGSFFRIRLPLLSVQTEVMERIVAKASTKYEKEQKSLRLSPIKLSTECAEASLAPLWKTIDRIHFKSASQNLSFKSALARLAIMMKKLYKAYLAVHALTLLAQSEESENPSAEMVQSESNPYVQRIRVSVHRIVSNAAGYSKQLLGNQATTHLVLSSIQSETIEDSLFTAADVFSSTELPSHRFAFLEKLAEFHRTRSRFAEEGTCRLHIYHTFREAAKQHAHIWSSSPFLPWASNQSDELLAGNEGPAGGAIVPCIDYDDNLSASSGKYLEKNTSFRRIFYRAADSVLVRTGDWAGFGGGKFLFYGVTLKSEFNSSTSWFTLREMEDAMVGQAETAGELFLRSGIVESSRSAYNLATHFYSETFNYARLAQAYRKLSRVVTSKIPVVDTSNQYDMSSQIGRFYKVYFHGGCPDDILHAQGSEGFIYRVPSSVGIREFASCLEHSVRSILPAKSTIDLLLDDGSPTMPPKTAGGKRQLGIGGAPIEPIKIKVTPIRPLFKMEDTEKCFRGTPEWFQLKSDEYDSMLEEEAQVNSSGGFLHQRQISVSTSNTYSSSGSTTISNRRSSFLSNYRNSRQQRFNEFENGRSTAETIGVDRFYFTQPAKKDPVRGFRDWLKVPTGSFAERSLRVTELQVECNFPACVTRQKIIHRAIFSQSPLEAGVEAVSTWCSLLFRTIMATNGLRVLSNMTMQEEGLNIICVAKVLADCIHSSGVKQIGMLFLSVNQPDNTNNETSYYSSYERLSEDEVEKVQTKLARIIVIFLELLHLLIARNRDVLLAVVQSRKRRGGDGASVASGSNEGYGAAPRMAMHHSPIKGGYDGQDSDSHYKSGTDILGKSISTSHNPSGHKVSSSDRTDAAIGVQSELQRGFISLVRALSPSLLDTINAEVPRWMRQCCQENYFSSGLYRQADIPIGEELFFYMGSNEDRGVKDDSSVPISINRGSGQIYRGSSPGNSVCGTEVSDGRRHEIPASTVSVQSTSHRSRHRETTSGSSQGTGKGGF